VLGAVAVVAVAAVAFVARRTAAAEVAVEARAGQPLADIVDIHWPLYV
jgi:hypothetical protein